MNAENVNVLLDQNRFNLDILPHLEAYLQHQLDSRSYHLEANLALLKFYQFHPEKAQKLITARIVAKALMQLPANDFSLCMYQIPERFHTEEPVLSLQNLASLLETSHFSNSGQSLVPAESCSTLFLALTTPLEDLLSLSLRNLTARFPKLPCRSCLM